MIIKLTYDNDETNQQVQILMAEEEPNQFKVSVTAEPRLQVVGTQDPYGILSDFLDLIRNLGPDLDVTQEVLNEALAADVVIDES